MTSTPLAIENPTTVTVESFLNSAVKPDRKELCSMLFHSKKSAVTFRYRCYSFRAHHAKIITGTIRDTPWDNVSLVIEEEGDLWVLTAYTDASFLGIVAQGSPDEMKKLAKELSEAPQR